MAYDFTLDKKGLISVLGASTFIAILLFLAGWMVGINWPITDVKVLAASSNNATASESEKSRVPGEPVLADEPALSDNVAPAKPTSRAAKDELIQPPDGAGSPKKSEGAETNKLDDSIAAAPPADVQVRIIEEAETEPSAGLNNSNVTATSRTFTVQVGVFVEQGDAINLFQQIERKGYAPSFFADRDAENRQWYAVRIGAYSDKDQAEKAAANFTNQEKIKAVVRPLDSL